MQPNSSLFTHVLQQEVGLCRLSRRAEDKHVKAAKVAVYFVVQMDLLRQKLVRCGQLALHWILNR